MYTGVPREGQGERLQHGATSQVLFKGGGGDGPIFHDLNNDEVQEPRGGYDWTQKTYSRDLLRKYDCNTRDDGFI